MQSKVFILSFISAAKHRFWRAGDWLVEIQSIYVLYARAEAPLLSHLCLAHSVSRKKNAGMEKNILYFSCQIENPSAQTSAISARNKS